MNTKADRKHYIDWLRIVATIGIFLFHNSRPYNFGDWQIKNAQTSLLATQFVTFMDMWMMPVFFILSGASVYYSLKSRNGSSFLKERFFRIMVPWLLTGIFLIAPPQVYLERLSHAQFNGNFFQFIPQYFNGWYGFGGNFAWMGLHVWYLMLLSIFSVILLPLFLPRVRTGMSPLQPIASKLGKPWVLSLLWIPVGVMALLSKAFGLGWTEQMGSWDILSYVMFFILGYVLFASTALQEVIKKQGGWFLLSAVVFSAVHLILKYYVQPSFYEDIDMRLLATWGWIVGLLWLGERLLNFTNRFLAHANEMVLPFYILHQTVIVVIAYFVVQTGLVMPTKYGVTVVISFVVIVALYELFISRIGVFRFLFGMKRKTITASPKRAIAQVT